MAASGKKSSGTGLSDATKGAIIVAVIGLIGTLGAAWITTNGNKPAAPTETPVPPTAVVVIASVTPLPPTATFTLTNTPFPSATNTPTLTATSASTQISSSKVTDAIVPTAQAFLPFTATLPTTPPALTVGKSFPCDGVTLPAPDKELYPVMKSAPSQDSLDRPAVQSGEEVHILDAFHERLGGRLWYEIETPDGTPLGWIPSTYLVPGPTCPNP